MSRRFKRIFVASIVFVVNTSFAQETLEANVVSVTCSGADKVTSFIFTKNPDVLMIDDWYADSSKKKKLVSGWRYGKIGSRQGNNIAVDIKETSSSLVLPDGSMAMPTTKKVDNSIRFILKVANLASIDRVDVVEVITDGQRGNSNYSFDKCVRRTDGLDSMGRFMEKIGGKYGSGTQAQSKPPVESKAVNSVSSCGNGGVVLFRCSTVKNKTIELCDAGKSIEYSFGPTNEKPEMFLRVPRSEVRTTQYEGVGRWESYSVDVPNGDTTYSVFWGLDKLSSNHTIEAGVNVEKGGKQVGRVLCAPNTKVLQNLEGVKLKSSRQ